MTDTSSPILQYLAYQIIPLNLNITMHVLHTRCSHVSSIIERIGPTCLMMLDQHVPDNIGPTCLIYCKSPEDTLQYHWYFNDF